MNPRFLLFLVAGTALAVAPAGAQNLQRRAMMTSGGGPEFGRCTGEVIVDGAAEVDIRGDMATLRDLSGRQPEWRSFECTAPLPATAGNIQFSGEGRGTQRMVRSPNDNGGVAVVHIEDRDAGANVYRFQISWNNARQYPAQTVAPMNGRFGADQAIQVCEDSIRDQARQRFGARQVDFRRVNMDDNPGRNDWVVGMIELRRPDGAEEHRRFSCSVNFQNGRVRTANIDEPEGFRGGVGSDRDQTAMEMENCQQALRDRIRNDGYRRIDFGQMNIGSRYGNDWITGTARADGLDHPESFDVSCSVNPNNGYVRSVDVRRR